MGPKSEKNGSMNEVKSLPVSCPMFSKDSVMNIQKKEQSPLAPLDDKSLLSKLKDLNSAIKVKEDSGSITLKKYEQGLHVPAELTSQKNTLIPISGYKNPIKEVKEVLVSNPVGRSYEQQEHEYDGSANNDEESDLTDAAETAGSWKIDYIRVETEETNNLKRANFKNEKWNTCKSKKDKQNRKRSISRRDQKSDSPGK